MRPVRSRQQRITRRLLGGGVVVLGGYLTTVLAAPGAQPPPTAAPAMRASSPVAAVDSAAASGHAAQARRRTFSTSTYSSPIALSRDSRLVWAVNPGADTVSVIRTDTNVQVANVRVGDEPQGVALDPSNRYAFVANAAGNSVSVIRITNARPGSFRARRVRNLITGGEPWNVVVSPDGRRAFVANSSQDTITVIDALRPRIIGDVNLRSGRCGDADNRHFQPRGMAIDRESNRLYVTSFLAFTRPGGRQADDTGRQGLVCRLSIDTSSNRIRDYRPARRIALAPQVTGFTVDANGDGAPDATSAFPNQLQSIVIRGGQAYLPNIAASPDGPLRFNVDTQAFVNVIDGIRTGTERDAGPAKFINLHLGARDPEPPKKRLFFANAWAIAFTAPSGPGAAYVVSAGSNLLVKVNVAADGRLANTVDVDTTRYIDLDDPGNAATAGDNAGKNPQGIVIDRGRRRAYVTNFVSRNVSVVDLQTDQVVKTIRTAPLPAPGSQEEIINVGADMFFGSRGNFNRPAGAAVSTSERLSSEGWQSCSSCHFKGLTDGVVWEFGTGPRKSVPLNPTFNFRDKTQQRVLNYSAIFDEIEDFELNARNVSGPGPLAAAQARPCSAPPPAGPATSTNDPNHGLIIGDNGDINLAPCVVNAFARPNAERPQVTVSLPGSNVAVPAMTALREWVKFAIRTPNPPVSRRSIRGGVNPADVAAGRALFQQQQCQSCHGGDQWTSSRKDFVSPPTIAPAPNPDAVTETVPPPVVGNPVAAQYLHRFLRNIGSFNIGVPGGGNDIGRNVGGAEKASQVLNAAGAAAAAQDALGFDYNNDGKGNGYSPPSLLGIYAVPPYYHNGACETLECVVGNVKHRTANGTLPDRLASERARRQVVIFLRSIGGGTAPFG